MSIIYVAKVMGRFLIVYRFNNMKNFSLICLLCLMNISIAMAATPKAIVNVNSLNNQGWPAQYKITLIVPKDHHAYLDDGDEHIYLPITINANSQLSEVGLEVSKLEKPAGIYDSHVKARVLRDQGDFILALNQAGEQGATIQNVMFDLKYQLCNELTNVCFRPQAAQFELALPPLLKSEATSSKALAPANAGLMDSLVALYKNHQENTLLIFGLMFLAGLLSVATPCVYPMLPITSMFILNRAQGNVTKERQHAMVYLFGMIGTYMALGLLAGLTGGAFNAVMQSAWVNLGFAIFFAFFAVSLLGFYELAFMQNEVHSLDQQSARIKGLTGTWLMGTVAGLVISPCVGPIVFALLLQIADNIALKAESLALVNQHIGFGDKLLISAQGSILMGGFGLGVGIPFFLVSVVKFKKLPKAGYWMNKIKYAFGLVILYFAYTYLAKGFGILGLDPESILAFALAIIVVWFAVVQFNVLTPLSAEAQPNQKMYHFCGVIALIIGGWLMVNSLGKLPAFSHIKNASLVSSATACDAKVAKSDSLTEQEAGISWYRNFDAAQQAAKASGLPIFIDFYASWCANCVAFKAETANNQELNRALREKAIAVKLIDQEPEFEKFRNNPQHRQLKIGLPYFVILTSDGQFAWSGTDYQASQAMIAELNRLTSDTLI